MLSMEGRIYMEEAMPARGLLARLRPSNTPTGGVLEHGAGSHYHGTVEIRWTEMSLTDQEPLRLR